MSHQKNAGASRRFARLVRFAHWLQALPQRLTPPPFRLLQLESSFWLANAVHVAARLDVATHLGEDSLDLATLAERCGAQPDALQRLLRLLLANDLFSQQDNGQYANNRLSHCLRRHHPQSVREMVLLHHHPVLSRPWSEQLEAGVRSGTPPFELSHGQELFAYLDQHPELDEQFSRAMHTVEALSGDSYARDFDWGRYRRLIDIGGSRGSKALTILRQHPHLHALVTDRPPVITAARAHWAAHPQPGSERLHFHPGDLRTDIPGAEAGDIYLLAAVLHGLDDATCRQVLQTLARASGNSGAPIALLETILPEQGANAAAAAMDMQMFMGTRGRERTLAQWQALIDGTGLYLSEVVALQSFASILLLEPLPAQRH